MGWLGPMLAVLIGAFMAILDTSIVNVATPAMMNALGVDMARIEWVATAYMLALGMVVPASGWLGDRVGYKRLYTLSLAVFTAGSLLCGLAWNLPSMIAARVVQALGGGLIMPTTMAMVYRMVPRDRIGSAMGVWGLALLLAPAIGPTLGGYLVEYQNWRLIFTINLPIGVGGLALASLLLPEFKDRRPGRFDAWGFVTAAGGLFALLLALSEGASWGWRSEPIVLLFYASAVLLGLFIYVELTQPEPLLDLRVFRHALFTVGNVLVVIITVGLFAGVFFVPLFLQTARGMGAMETGLLMLPSALMTGLMMPIAGRLFDRLGPRVPVTAGIVLLAWSSYLFHGMTPATPEELIRSWLVIRGLGMGLAMMPATTAAMAVIPAHLVSRASAVHNIIQRVAGSFGIAVLGSLLQQRTAFHGARLAEAVTADRVGVLWQGAPGGVTALLAGEVGEQSLVAAMDDLFLVLAILSIAGLVPALLLRRAAGGGRGGPLVAMGD